MAAEVHANITPTVPLLAVVFVDFHRLLEGLVVAQLTTLGMTPEEARVAALAGAFVVEGLLSHPHTMTQREQVIDWLVGRTPGGGV